MAGTIENRDATESASESNEKVDKIKLVGVTTLLKIVGALYHWISLLCSFFTFLIAGEIPFDPIVP